MIPILYQTVTEGTVPSDYGIGALTDCLECKVTEERNGIYELSLSYASSGIHASEIQVGRIIKAKPNFTDNPQLFRIYKVGKNMNGRFEVNAQHISYDLSGKIITSGTATTCATACQLLTTNAGNFTISTTKTVTADFKISEPSSVRSWFAGKQGSLLDVYGTGEWQYDNYTAELKLNRGTDRGVTIRYEKNLTELSQEIDIQNLATAVQGYYKDSETGAVTLGTKISTGLVLDYTKDIVIDFSSEVDTESGTAISTQLDNLTNNYIANNQLGTAFSSITLNFVQSGELVERVDLCDTVHIFFEALGISTALKCIKVVWDCLADRYTSCTFGDSKTNITDTIVSVQKEVKDKPSLSIVENAARYASDLISGNLGGYVLLHDADNDGKPDEILILDNASGGDISQAVDVWRWNKAGLGHSSNGYSGPYDSVAITYDGKINASSITTGTLNADLIKAGVISDVNGNSTIDMATGIAKLYQLIAKRDFTIKDENDLTKGYISVLTNGTVVLRLLDATGQSTRAQLGVNTYGRGTLYLDDENGNARVTAFGDGGLVIKDANGDTVIDLDGGNDVISLPTGRFKAPNQLDKVYDGSLSSVGDWWTFDPSFAYLLVVGNVKSGTAKVTATIPTEMITTTPTRFQIADDANYVSFEVTRVDNGSGELIEIKIVAKNSTGAIEKVYGMF